MAFKKEVLKAWRIKKKLSQAKAAEILDMTQAFYSQMEIGKKLPSLGTLEIISNRTKISVSELLDTSNPTQPSLRRKRTVKGAAAKAAEVS